MSRAPIRDQTIALAGLFQSLALIQNIARHGQVQALDALDCSLGSLLALDAPDTESVYGGKLRLRMGLQALGRQLNATRSADDDQLTQYAAGVIYLERRFAKSDATKSQVAARLNEISASCLPDGSLATDWITAEIIGRFADIYVGIISPLGPKIMVRGEPAYLQLAVNTDLIRALLLAALRSVVLWRQVGGNRWRMIFKKHLLQRCLWTLTD